MRHREQVTRVLTQLGRHLGFEVQINAPPPHQKLREVNSVAEVEWLLPLAERINTEQARQFVENFPEHLPVAGFVLSEPGDRAAQQFYHLAALTGRAYPLAFLITDGAAAYRRAHRILRSFHHLFGPRQTLVVDAQQLDAVFKNLDATTELPFQDIREPHFLEMMDPVAAPAGFKQAASKTWAAQIKSLLIQKGQEAGLLVSENASPIDFSGNFENLREHFATVQGYLQPVLLEEIGQALGYYHSFTPLENRPPVVSNSWSKKFDDIKIDVIWNLDLPSGLARLLDRFYELDKGLRYAAPPLHSRLDTVPLVGFVIERTLTPATAGRLLTLSRGCHFGIVILPLARLAAIQNFLKLLSGRFGLANVITLPRQQLLQKKPAAIAL